MAPMYCGSPWMGVRTRRPVSAVRAGRDLSKAMGDSKKEIKRRSRRRRSEGEAGPERAGKDTRRGRCARRRAKPTTLLGRARKAAVSPFHRACRPSSRPLLARPPRPAPTRGPDRRPAPPRLGPAQRGLAGDHADPRPAARGARLRPAARPLAVRRLPRRRDRRRRLRRRDPVGRAGARGRPAAELGTAHAYLRVPAALIAIAILLRRQPQRPLAALPAGGADRVAAVVVAIVVDRPAGLDEGTLVRDFTGVEAKPARRLLGAARRRRRAGGHLAAARHRAAARPRRPRARRPPAAQATAQAGAPMPGPRERAHEQAAPG